MSNEVRIEFAQPAARGYSLTCLLALCLCNVGHFYAVASIFSYAGIMTADLGWAEDRNHAGSIAGFLQSANVLGRIPTSGLWGYFADRFGPSRGLMIAMASQVVGSILFGLSTEKNLAIVVRFVFLGALNGWPAFFAPMVMEIGGPEHQVEVTGRVFAAGMVVQLFGPAIGGFTYGWVQRFPALVPNLIGSFLCVCAIISTHMYLRGLGRKPKASAGKAAPPTSEAKSTLAISCERPMPLLMFLRSMQGYTNFSFLELVPLWAITSRSMGGLELNENDIGMVLAASSLLTGTWLAVGLPRASKRFGIRCSTVVANFLVMCGLVALPYTQGFASLIVTHTIVASGSAVLGVSYIAAINNVVPAGHRATVNGVCVTFEALAKGIGPFSSAVSFAWVLSRFGVVGHSAVFIFLSAVHLMLMLGSMHMPDEVEAPRHSPGAIAMEKARNSPAAGDKSATLPSIVGRRRKGGEYAAAAVDEQPLEEEASPEASTEVGVRRAANDDIGFECQALFRSLGAGQEAVERPEEVAEGDASIGAVATASEDAHAAADASADLG